MQLTLDKQPKSKPIHQRVRDIDSIPTSMLDDIAQDVSLNEWTRDDAFLSSSLHHNIGQFSLLITSCIDSFAKLRYITHTRPGLHTSRGFDSDDLGFNESIDHIAMPLFTSTPLKPCNVNAP